MAVQFRKDAVEYQVRRLEGKVLLAAPIPLTIWGLLAALAIIGLLLFFALMPFSDVVEAQGYTYADTQGARSLSGKMSVNAIVLVPASKSAQIEEGQAVKIELTAFPSDTFGIVRGRVSSVSEVFSKAPSKDDTGFFYRVPVRLEQQSLSAARPELKITAGAPLNAQIATDTRTMLERLLTFQRHPERET